MQFPLWNPLQRSNTRVGFVVGGFFLNVSPVLGFYLAFLLCLFSLHFFLQGLYLLHRVCVYVFLERRRDFTELPHPTAKEFGVSHSNVNKEETEVTQEL